MTLKNAHLPVYILFYAWGQGDQKRYPLSLQGLCELKNNLDEYGLRVIANWQPTSFPPPSDAQLESYDYHAVKSWYKQTYEMPEQVRNAQAAIRQLSMTESELTSMVTDTLQDNTLVFNTTLRKWMVFDASSNAWSAV